MTQPSLAEPEVRALEDGRSVQRRQPAHLLGTAGGHIAVSIDADLQVELAVLDAGGKQCKWPYVGRLTAPTQQGAYAGQLELFVAR